MFKKPRDHAVAATSRFFREVQGDAAAAEHARKTRNAELLNDAPDERAKAVAAWQEYQQVRRSNPFGARAHYEANATLINAGARLAAAAADNDPGPEAA